MIVLTRTMGAKGLAIVKHFEQGPKGGPALVAYLCPAGVPTIGWGHTRNVQMGDTCTEEEAQRWLEIDLFGSETSVGHLIRVPLTQNQFDALVSFTFNLGPGALGESTLRARLNQGRYDDAAAEFPRWNKGRVNGDLVVLDGLVKRRAMEKALFLEI